MFDRVRGFGGSKELPAGVYLVKVADLSKFENDYGIRIRWLFDVFSYPDGRPLADSLGRPLRLVDFSSPAMGEKAKARRWAEALLQRPLSEGDGGDELAKELIGRMAVATVVTQNRGYPKIDSLAVLPPQFQAK